MNPSDDCHSYGGYKRKKELTVIPTLQPPLDPALDPNKPDFSGVIRCRAVARRRRERFVQIRGTAHRFAALESRRNGLELSM
jgi:hypothetical protein